MAELVLSPIPAVASHPVSVVKGLPLQADSSGSRPDPPKDSTTPTLQRSPEIPPPAAQGGMPATRTAGPVGELGS